VGLMQFMPATWSWVAPEPWKSLGPLNPEAAIFVGCKYLRMLWDRFPTAVQYHRKAFSNASYNSGLGNVRKAQKRCAMKPSCRSTEWDWPMVEANLVTASRFQVETRTYVTRIRRFEKQICLHCS
jgi:soluble lytic murein transglycosylase-like protein